MTCQKLHEMTQLDDYLRPLRVTWAQSGPLRAMGTSPADQEVELYEKLYQNLGSLAAAKLVC